MFEFMAELHETDMGLKEINEALRELKSREVLVGIPDDSASRPDDGNVGNADLLYIHTNGSPVHGIPPRPVLEPAIEHDAENISNLIQKAVDAALAGNKDGVETALEKAGMHGQNVARKWFNDPANGWAANDPATIKAKGSAKPLIDTAEMQKAITHKVVKG